MLRFGRYTAVLSLCLATLGLPIEALAFTVTKTVNFTTKGQAMTFDFASLPAVTGSSVTVTVTLHGDYGGSQKLATVSIDGQAQADHTGGSACPSAGMAKSYSVSPSLLSDSALSVKVSNSTKVDDTCSNGNRVIVTVGYSTTPDLTITSATAPSSGSTDKAGDSFEVKYTVRCWHEGVTTDFYVHLLHCPSATPYACVKIGEKKISSSFTAGESKDFTQSGLLMPASASAGTSYIRFEVDATSTVTETVETNNTRYDAISVSAKPDLSFDAAKVPESGSTTAAGSKFTAGYTVANKATTSGVSTNFTVSYAYCSSTAASSCTPIGDQVIVQNVDSGAAISFTTPVLALPSSASTGTRYIRAKLDSKDDVSEASESNNELYSAITVGGAAADGGTDLNLVDTIPVSDAPWPDAASTLDAAQTGDQLAAAKDMAPAEQWFWPDTGSSTRDSGTKPADPPGDDGCAVGAGRSADLGGCVGFLILGLALALLAAPRRS